MREIVNTVVNTQSFLMYQLSHTHEKGQIIMYAQSKNFTTRVVLGHSYGGRAKTVTEIIKMYANDIDLDINAGIIMYS